MDRIVARLAECPENDTKCPPRLLTGKQTVNTLVLPVRGDENKPTMKKYPLRRLGVAHEPGDDKPSLSTCIEAVLEQSDALLEDVLEGLQTVCWRWPVATPCTPVCTRFAKLR